MGRPLVLVLGGTRSGKSTFGARRMQELASGIRIVYLATALSGADHELDDRIRRHRAARPSEWPTIDVGSDLPGAVSVAGEDAALLLDGLTLWLSLVAGDVHDMDAVLEGPVQSGLDALLDHPGPVVVISDEIGLGVVPMEPQTRAFRDLQGIVHQRLAEAADEVVLTVAGLPLMLKPR
jgi:adenosylcobinamide kinase/adenosylcobinamide-phosphate guanylyltransferase